MAQVLIFSWISGVSVLSPTHTLALSETDTHTHTPINSNTEHAVAFFCHTHYLDTSQLTQKHQKPSKGTLCLSIA